MSDWVPIESATVHVLDLSGCGLCGRNLELNAWYVSGNERDRCSGCYQVLNETHVICPGCGAHNTVVRA